MKTLGSTLGKGSKKTSVRDAVEKLRSRLSPRQLEFVDDPYRFKILVAGRRGGKSYADGAYMLITCLLNPKRKVLYCGLTRESAKNAIWPILIEFLQFAGIEHTVEISTLTVKLSNGSSIQVTGADQTNMAARLRGQKFALVVVDETGFFAGLGSLIEALLPTLADYKGSLVMTSSPGELLSGVFYEAYEGTLKDQWHPFQWDLRDNPHFMGPSSNPSKWSSAGEEELDIICRLQFNGDRTHPAFVREYLGKYVKDASHLVYPVLPVNLSLSQIPVPQVSLGIALGPNGQFGAVTVEHSPYSRDMNIINNYQGSLTKTEDLEVLRTWYGYSDFRICVRGGHTEDVLQELARRFELPFADGAVTDKAFFQLLFRDDLVAGHIRVRDSLPILKEWSRIVRDAAGVEIDDGSTHLLSDAALALYRHVYTVHLKHWTPPKTDEEIMIDGLVKRAMEEAEDERDQKDLGY